MWTTPIQRISNYINGTNDAVIGMPSAPGGPGISKFQGQLGAGTWLDDNQVAAITNTAIGTVYGGHFRYVRLSAASTAVVVGQIVFWDILATAADNKFQVTTLETGSADGAMLRAGIVLNNGWAPGNYSFIQDVGPIYVKFRGTLTATGAAGSRVFAAAVGAGVDNGFADVIDSASPTLFSDVSKMLGRYIGIAQETPTSGGLKRVYVAFENIRG